MSVMPRDHEWTVADLAHTPDDGLRYELVDGVLLVSPAPTNRHQIVLGELYALLRAARTADVRVLVAPTDFQPTDRRSLQPDLLVARRADVGDDDPISAPLLLAVEVLQAVVGISQYELGVPVPLVALHLLGASLSVAAATDLLVAVRRPRARPVGPAAAPATAAAAR